jgi:hypothetical protein
MLTNTAGLGWGWKSLNPVKVIKKTVVAPTKFLTKKAVDSSKWAVKRTIVQPTQMVAKSAVGVTKASVGVATKLAKGDVTGAAKSAVAVAKAPAQLAYDTTKHAAGTVTQASKAAMDFVLAPLRSKLGTFKMRRATKIAMDRRGSNAPTAAEKAQARKDVKSYLSAKGPHGKMLAWLAGGPMFAGELGVVGYDDAAIAAIATALTATAVKIISDAAKSKFAPAAAVKQGAAAGTAVAAQAAQEKVAQYLPPVAEEEAAPAEPVTQEEVAAEPAAEAEEEATATDTEAMEGALAGLGMLAGFAGVAEEAVAPASMTETTAKRIAGAAQRMVCGMSAPALNAIGGLEAVNAAGTLCRAAAAGDEAAVRAVLPSVVQIASRAASTFATTALNMGVRNEGGLPNDGFGGSLAADPSDMGALLAFDGADPEGLAYGLAGVTPDDLAAEASATEVPVLALLPAVALAAVGFWMAFRK